MENQNSLRDEYKTYESCNGRGHKLPKRYTVQHRCKADFWKDVPNASFVGVNDALLYASMCSCYPIIYGMTRVVDTLDGRVVQTYSAGEGQLTPKQDPNLYYLQLRYTVTPKGETWGWLPRSFTSLDMVIKFVRDQLLPRSVCDAVRIIKDNHNFLTWYYTKPTRNDAADSLACSNPCTRDTDGDGDCPRCAPPRGLPKSMFGFFPVVDMFKPEVSRSKNGTHVTFGPATSPQSIGKTAGVFDAWMRERFNTAFNPEIDLHCAMFEAFRAGLQLNVVRPHQS